MFTPPAGTYTAAQTVTISSATAAAAIYYTTDGTAPTASSSKYSTPIAVSTSETLKAIAMVSGAPASAVGTAQYVLNYPGPTLSASSYSFAQNTVGNAITATVATLTNPSSAAVTLNTSISGDASMTLVAAQSCGAQLAAGASCPIVVQYLPASAGTQTASVAIAYSGNASGSASVALSGTATAAAASTVASTSNPLVALYTVTPGSAANVTVQFGLDTTYGYTTSAFPTPATNSAGPVNVEVGGMRANTTYHMRAQIAYTGGNTVTTADQTFTTGSLPADLASRKLTVTTAAGMTPQPGIELLDPTVINGNGTWRPYATDLQGNIIWYYPWADYPGSPYLVNGIKQLSNGDFLAALSPDSSATATLQNASIDPTKVFIREFDLIGNTVNQLSLADLNTALAAGGYTESDGTTPLVLTDFHHDVTPLPNGHWLIMASTTEVRNNITVGGQVQNNYSVQGDVVVDVDTTMKPAFVWDEFDHLDVDRQPMGFPDWTHSNAIVYSPTDGDFIVSIRHQNWVVKVNYQNGAGDGSVIWRLGNQGDFSLLNADGTADTNPYDWQYAQHGPSFVGTTTAGTFQLTLMDNGNDRIVAGNTAGCPSGEAADCYSTIPVFQIDEDAKTATVLSRVTTSPTQYSDFGGNAEVLANNDLEYDLCGPTSGSTIEEVQQDTNHTPVWSFYANGDYEYRGFRLPSLYQGVQWP